MIKKTILYLAGFVLVVVFLYSIKDMRTNYTYLHFAIAGTIIGFASKWVYCEYQRRKNVSEIIQEKDDEITTGQ